MGNIEGMARAMTDASRLLGSQHFVADSPHRLNDPNSSRPCCFRPLDCSGALPFGPCRAHLPGRELAHDRLLNFLQKRENRRPCCGHPLCPDLSRCRLCYDLPVDLCMVARRMSAVWVVAAEAAAET